MFAEKAGGGTSMTRCIAFAFALTHCLALLLLTFKGNDIGWPMALLGVCNLLSVPLQRLFSSRLGKELTEKLLARLGAGSDTP
jgi:hypothetical protein